MEALNNGAPTLDIRAHLNETSGNNKRTTHRYEISTEVTRHKYTLLALMVLSGNRATKIFLVIGELAQKIETCYAENMLEPYEMNLGLLWGLKCGESSRTIRVPRPFA